MKQVLLCVTIATAIASSTLSAHAETVTKTLQLDEVKQASAVVIPQSGDAEAKSAKLGDMLALNPQPLPPARKSTLNPQPLPPRW
jgi:hypothetical protein